MESMFDRAVVIRDRLIDLLNTECIVLHDWEHPLQVRHRAQYERVCKLMAAIKPEADWYDIDPTLCYSDWHKDRHGIRPRWHVTYSDAMKEIMAWSYECKQHDLGICGGNCSVCYERDEAIEQLEWYAEMEHRQAAIDARDAALADDGPEVLAGSVFSSTKRGSVIRMTPFLESDSEVKTLIRRQSRGRRRAGRIQLVEALKYQSFDLAA